MTLTKSHSVSRRAIGCAIPLAILYLLSGCTTPPRRSLPYTADEETRQLKPQFFSMFGKKTKTTDVVFVEAPVVTADNWTTARAKYEGQLNNYYAFEFNTYVTDNLVSMEADAKREGKTNTWLGIGGVSAGVASMIFTAVNPAAHAAWIAATTGAATGVLSITTTRATQGFSVASVDQQYTKVLTEVTAAQNAFYAARKALAAATTVTEWRQAFADGQNAVDKMTAAIDQKGVAVGSASQNDDLKATLADFLKTVADKNAAANPPKSPASTPLESAKADWLSAVTALDDATKDLATKETALTTANTAVTDDTTAKTKTASDLTAAQKALDDFDKSKNIVGGVVPATLAAADVETRTGLSKAVDAATTADKAADSTLTDAKTTAANDLKARDTAKTAIADDTTIRDAKKTLFDTAQKQAAPATSP